MSHFHIYRKEDLQSLINSRNGEIKLGESLQYCNHIDDVSQLTQKFIIIGIPEDIGVRANGGIGGTYTAWQSFLKSFINIQENIFLSFKHIALLGVFNFEDLLQKSANANTSQLRNWVRDIDDVVYPVIQKIIDAGKIPIVIGGGHNNCYPILKGCSNALNKKINVINLDAHADYRIMEGRHSGNGFRYAMEDNFLNRYAMLGLHNAYNNQDIINEIEKNNSLNAIWWNDIFLRDKLNWKAAIAQSLDFVQDDSFGVELDTDCIENMLSSAQSPVGITSQQAMLYLYESGKNNNSCYLHIPEAIAERADGITNPLCGKLLSYLVQSFITGKLDQLLLL